MTTKVKTATEIENMRVSGRMLAAVLHKLRQQLQVGMSTQDLDDIAVRELAALGGEPAFKGYQDFPKSLCVSVNDEVVHGIPCAAKIINEGDIVGLDFGVNYKGMITDAAVSVIAGQPKTKGDIQLLKDTENALMTGIAAVHDKVRTGDIGFAIEESLKNHRYGIVRDLVGHGVGHTVHEDPNIPNYGRPNTGPWLDAGMTIAIEPMVTLGGDAVYIAPDGWTVLTRDGARAAHFEHTVLITDTGAEILTTL
jgi:methionyl aminopeptidase